VSIFQDPPELRELRRRLHKREVELGLARNVLAAARAAAAADERLGAALAAYDAASSEWRYDPLPDPPAPPDHAEPRFDPSRDHEHVLGGWHRGGPHGSAEPRAATRAA
jgi:hypothetical protein